jgi:hypothetical protein
MVASSARTFLSQKNLTPEAATIINYSASMLTLCICSARMVRPFRQRRSSSGAIARKEANA